MVQLTTNRQERVEFDHAINYVTTVQKRFASDPTTYNKFLEILNEYRNEERSMKEVIDEVIVLFIDHPDLLMKMTDFLPYEMQDEAKAYMELAVRISVDD